VDEEVAVTFEVKQPIKYKKKLMKNGIYLKKKKHIYL
jgi:hypothetical protein